MTTQNVKTSFKTSSSNTSKEGTITCSGTDNIGPLFNDVGVLGQIAQVIPLNPMTWDGTRAQAVAATYEKCCIKSITVKYSPTCPTSTKGAYLAYWDPDSMDIATVGQQGINDGLSHPHNMAGSIYTANSFTIKPGLGKYLYMSPQTEELRLTECGKIWFIITQPTDQTTIGLWGNITLSYVLQFSQPGMHDINTEVNVTDMARQQGASAIIDGLPGTSKMIGSFIAKAGTHAIDNTFTDGVKYFYKWLPNLDSGESKVYNTIYDCITNWNAKTGNVLVDQAITLVKPYMLGICN
jgi:hypothetical protein